VARRYLSSLYRYVGKNRRCRQAEIDLIFLDGEVVVIVEVKTRLGSRADALAGLNFHQESIIRQAAKSYLREHGLHPLTPYRFEVVGVSLCPETFSALRVVHGHLNQVCRDESRW
jgi:putative endonuclease